MGSTRQKALLEIHSAVFLFGLAGLFGKWLTFSPLIIVFGRVCFACAALAVFIFLSQRKFSIFPKSSYAILFFLGLLLATHWIAFFQSIQVSTVAVGLLSYSTFPIFTVFLEPLFFKKRIEVQNVFYAGLCLLGIFFIIPRFDLQHSVFQGVLWGVLSGFTFSVLTILNRKLSQKYSSLLIAFYEDISASVFLFPFLFIVKYSIGSKDIFLLFILGVLCTACSHTLFIKGMKYVQAQKASIISSLEPVYGIILAFIFLQEIPSLRTILGGIIILGSALKITLKKEIIN